MADNHYDKLKDDGNLRYKMKNYEDALALYTQALSLNEKGLLAYSNRAMCHINLERFYEAKEDCDKVISLDPKFTKAYYRRAIANRELYRFRDAIADLKKVIQLDPEFVLAKKELDELLNHIQKDNRISLRVFLKPSSQQSTRPMRTFAMLNQYTGTKQYEN